MADHRQNYGATGAPLVVDDLVLVATEGKLAAYDVDTGEPRWFGPAGGAGYSSPHLLTIGGAEQILLVSGTGVVVVNGNVTIAQASNSSFSGLLYVNGNLTLRGTITVTINALAGSLATGHVPSMVRSWASLLASNARSRERVRTRS